MSMRWSVETSVVPARFTRLVSLSAAAAFGIACSSDRKVTLTGVTSEASSVAAAPSAGGAPIKDRYIVVFRDAVANPAAEADALMRGRGGEIHFRYSRVLKGFAATIPQTAIDAIRGNPRVAYVEQDATVRLEATQTSATWGLDRIDQRSTPLNQSYSYDFDGTGVTAYIIDTGIRTNHIDFGSRASDAGFSVINDGLGTTDCDGHGTHVAGTVGGLTYGVAKNVQLVPVRVLDCTGSGSWSGVIAGMEWVAANAVPNQAVANMSLGGGSNAAINDAVAQMTAAGITVVVAAGNSNSDACRSSPAAAPSAITVGATTSTDGRASYSNYGSCLDIFAPGSSITSTWSTSTTAINTISGTSMASPHVAGAAALVIDELNGASPSVVTSTILARSTQNVVGSAGRGSPNRLLYSLKPGAPTAPTNLAVTVTSKRGAKTANLSWVSGGASAFVVYKNDVTLKQVSQTSTTDALSGSGSVTYKVCNADNTSLCTGPVTVSY